ncbi:MAG TPA: phosphoglucosamine mutase, partial [Actinomycetota bacterium]|nr:phosphoglucosamine mutase [Actinomycetota bacterium]
PIAGDVGEVVDLDDGADRYVAHLIRTVPEALNGLRVVLDCAYGAAWRLGPRAFKEAGADVIALHAEPDGSRINVDCGSTNLTELAVAVVKEGADLGLAFDGDADRVLAVDERGEEVDGDRIMGMMALHLHATGHLKNDRVVATVMTNLGFRRALEDNGIEIVSAPVGDKFVAQAMVEHGAVLGGEQSGHIIFSEYSTTGDGILTGLQLAQILRTSADPMSKLAHFYEPFPQVLINVRVASKDGLEAAEEIWAAVAAAEEGLGDDGRVLVRASGTEPLVRVMVEATDEALAQRTATELSGVVTQALRTP